MICILLGCLLCRLFTMAEGSGESCQDLDPQACSDMAKQNPNMCMDHDLATAVCPKHCHRCPITCYNCNTTTTDVHGCNTFTCNSDEVCLASEINQLMVGEHFYNLRCASESACTDRQFSDVLSADTKCCFDDLCNTPDLISHTTSSSSSSSLTTIPITTFISTTASPLQVAGPACGAPSYSRFGRRPALAPCEDGQRDDGASCWSDPHVYAKGCCCTSFGCCGCKAGYHDDGCVCRKVQVGVVKTQQDRFICRDDEEDPKTHGGLCYPKCKDGFREVGCCVCEAVC